MIRLIYTLLMTSILSGCSFFGGKDPDPEVLTFLPAAQITGFDVTAKISVTGDGRTDTGSIRWVHLDTRDEWSFFSPTGSLVASLIVTPESSTLTTPDKVVEAMTPETLFEMELNWPLPVSFLPYWVRGLPAPNVPYDAKTGEAGRITRLTQAGWTVAYQGTQPIQSGADRYELPRRLLLSRGEQVSIRWASTEWRLIPRG